MFVQHFKFASLEFFKNTSYQIKWISPDSFVATRQGFVLNTGRNRNFMLHFAAGGQIVVYEGSEANMVCLGSWSAFDFKVDGKLTSLRNFLYHFGQMDLTPGQTRDHFCVFLARMSAHQNEPWYVLEY